jgi:hypothetical protein
MRIGGAHLTYCTNIHAGESWADVRANLARYTLAVKRRVCPEAPFGVGLRLSARAAAECDVAELKRFLDANGMYVFTLNGFPHGVFHGVPVKEQVYEPDWSTDARIAYTERLAAILAELLPDGVDGSISTVPLYYQPWRGNTRGVQSLKMQTSLVNLAVIERSLTALEARTGKHIVLALEPEPSCAIETTFDAHALFATLDAEVPGHRHLGLCLDTCHAAVEYEHLPTTLMTLAIAKVPIAKIQLGCGLRIQPVDPFARTVLEVFAEGTYLHQTIVQRNNELVHYDDLPQALRERWGADEWRVHFHVPIVHADIPPFATTQPYLAELLAEHKRSPISTHLEVETYTWDVLPAHLRDQPIDEAIAAELAWVIERLR